MEKLLRKIKSVFKYVIVFFFVVIILLMLLVVTAKIPKESIEENIEESVSYLSRNTEINYIKRKHPFMWLHIYADEMILNIINNIDTSKPLESVLEAKYYDDGLGSLKEQMEDKTLEANKEYIRYWYGSMIFVRSMLVFFNIYEIYVVNAVIMLILLLFLLGILIKKKQKALVVIFIVAFIMTGSVFVPFCLEYTWVYMIMLIVSIIAVLIEKKGNKVLRMLFFITGILTCFFDFLSAELVTLLVPLTLILGIRYKEKRIDSLKENMKFLLSILISWLVGYFGMWIAKWLIASIVLKINALDYVVDKALVRVNGVMPFESKSEMYLEVIPKNIFSLYPFNLIVDKLLLLYFAIVMLIAFIVLKKDKKEIKKIIPFLVIAVIPYIRYLVLANHSYRHYFFTFREQFSTIMCIILIFIYGIDKNKMNKTIKIKKKDWKVK